MKKFTQTELEAAYKQMEEERKEDDAFADKAAKKLETLLQNSKATCPHVEGNDGMRFFAEPWTPAWSASNHAPIQPGPCEYEIYTQLCDYDNWEKAHSELSKYCNLNPMGHRQKIEGTWDLSNDPDFAKSRVKKFRIFVHYYDSHAGGY